MCGQGKHLTKNVLKWAENICRWCLDGEALAGFSLVLKKQMDNNTMDNIELTELQIKTMQHLLLAAPY